MTLEDNVCKVNEKFFKMKNKSYYPNKMNCFGIVLLIYIFILLLYRCKSKRDIQIDKHVSKTKPKITYLFSNTKLN